MNTNPDEAKLALWLDGELQGKELTEFEAELHSRSIFDEQSLQRDGVVRWKSMISNTIPASEEPPYPDFFNSRISTAIKSSRSVPSAAKRSFSWRNLLMPMAACAGMAMAFWFGMQSQSRPMEIDVTGAPKAIPVEPMLYTPESGVEAQYIAGTDAAASVIILNGVDAISDDTDFSETAAVQSIREMDATAKLKGEPEEEYGL